MRGRLVLVLAFLCGGPFAGCTVTPDFDPLDGPVSGECQRCVRSEGGPGCLAEDTACSDDVECENSLECALIRRCFEEGAEPDCIVQGRCAPRTAVAADLFEAFESCVRSVCAEACDFAPIDGGS